MLEKTVCVSKPDSTGLRSYICCRHLTLFLVAAACVIHFFAVPARARELNPDAQAEVILGLGTNFGEKLGANTDIQVQGRWKKIFAGGHAHAETYSIPLLEEEKWMKSLYQNRGFIAWLGGHYGDFSLALRFSRLTEEWWGQTNIVNNRNSGEFKSGVYPDYVGEETTFHPGLSFGWKVDDGHHLEFVADVGRQLRARYVRTFQRIALSGEAGRHRVDHGVFLEPVWYSAQLSARFSPLLRPVAESHFHVILCVGVHLFDFPEESGFGASNLPFWSVALKLALSF